MTETAELDQVRESIVDFYDELGLSRDDSVEKIQEALSRQKPEFASRRGRAGEKGQAARDRLKLIEAAEGVFRDDDSREAYDRTLVRKPTTETTEESDVDWLGRSWSYYFMQDYGAAAVAARKAREQTPNEPMPYVVSSWINLAEQELRRAKQDVDEAFVLDELGEDTADVQHVRGAVFFNQATYDRALQSFDRAYAKSSNTEKADLLRRKAWAFEYLEDGEAALVAALDGFTLLAACPPEEISPSVLEDLTEIVMRSLDYLAGTVRYPGRTETGEAPKPQEIIKTYRGLKERVRAVAIPQTSLNRITEHIAERIAVEELRVRATGLEVYEPPSGEEPGLPLKSIGAGVFTLLLSGVWLGFLLVTLVCAAWAVYTFVKRSEWKKSTEEYKRAQRDLEKTASSWAQKRENIRVPAPPVPMSIRHGR